MKLRGSGQKMPCESCAVQFSVFRRKRACSECERFYCSACLRRGGGSMCAACRVLSTRPLNKITISHLKVRDLQSFLQRQNVSTRGCVEKEELVNLCVSHVNSTQYSRRGQRQNTFNTLKGFTNNINEFITTAFDLRTTQNATRPQNTNCYNSSHPHSHAGREPRAAAAHPPHTPPERFTTTPGGERDIEVEVPPAQPSPSESTGSGGERVETDDCFEIEDLDDAGWEFVTKPAEPLPTDSEVLLSETEPRAAAEGTGSEAHPAERSVGEGLGGLEAEASASPARAASALELRSPDRERAAPPDVEPDSASLQDEPVDTPHTYIHESSPRQWPKDKKIILEEMRSWAEVDALSIPQLKELLVRNRVEFRGCVERGELLQRARTLWDDHARYRGEIDNMPIEECCKICMAAPLECVLLECGHIAACAACSRLLAECPICRQYVVRAVRCFRS